LAIRGPERRSDQGIRREAAPSKFGSAPRKGAEKKKGSASRGKTQHQGNWSRKTMTEKKGGNGLPQALYVRS